MFKSLLLALGILITNSTFAANSLMNQLGLLSLETATQQAGSMGLNWKVGEKNEYKIDMTILQGTMVMQVREITAEGIWLDQIMDMGPAGKQTASALLDKETGELKKMLVDGKEQEIPENTTELIDTKEDRITVPAGTYDCIHARLRDTKNNEESDMWANPRDIPLSGILKSVKPFQFGTMTMELVRFVKK